MMPPLRRLKDWVRLRLASKRYQRIYMFYWRAKTHLWSIGIGTLFVAGMVVTFAHRMELGRYFRELDPTLLPQLCIGVGAALIGLIAVVYTLSLFVIQQISDRSVPGILREYAADNVTRTIYLALAVLAVTCLLGALFARQHHPVLVFSLPIFCAASSLVLLSALFVRVAFLSDPSNIVSHVWHSATHEVKRLRIVQEEFVRLNPGIKNETDLFGRTIDNVGDATAALYIRAPWMTRKLRRSLDHLHSLMRHFSVEQQYALLDEAGGAVADILQKYTELRGSSLIMANSTTAMLGMESRWDSVIVASVETFAALMRIAVESGDTQGAQTLIRSLAKFGYAAVQWTPYNAPPGENPTAAFVVGYLTIVAKQSVAKKNEDVILTINDQLLSIAAALAAGGYEVTALWLIGEWSQIATLATVSQQQTAATDAADALLKLWGIVIDRQIAHSGIAKRIRDVVMSLCQLEATLQAKGRSLGSNMSVSPDTPLRMALSGVSAVSIQNLHAKLVNLIVSNYADEKHEVWSRCIHMLEDMDDGLWMRFEKIGLASASGSESVLFYLNQAAYSIAEQLLWLWKYIDDANLPAIDLSAIADGEERVRAARRMAQRASFKKKLEDLLHWHVIAFYSRCRTLQPPNQNNMNLRDCFSSATAIAIQALGIGIPKLAVDCAQTIGNSCTALLRDGGVASVVENCRVISALPELGLVGLHEHSDEVLAAVQTTLQSFLAQAQLLTAQQPEAFNWSSPFRLITESLVELANGNGDNYSGARLTVWHPTYTRQEAQEYLERLTTALT